MADNKTLGASVAGALIVGALAGSLMSGGSDAPETLENAPVGIVNQPPDPSPTPEPTGPLITDLDSPPVKPGAQVVAEVNLRRGWAPISGLTLTGEAAGKFRVVARQMVGRTFKVLAENTSSEEVRFTATFQYDKAR